MVRQNLFQRMRRTSLKAVLHWTIILINLLFIVASIAALVLSWHEKSKAAPMLRAFVIFMTAASAARIFQLHYERRYPIIVYTEWGTVIERPVTTIPGHVALFLNRNLSTMCLLACIFVALVMDKTTADEAVKHSKTLYTAAMLWLGLYFLYIIMPAFLIVGLVICLPCIVVVLQRFYNINPVGQNGRAGPATIQILDKIWKTKYQADESVEYKNPEKPEQHLKIQKEDTKCSICLSWYDSGDELRILPCLHHFHLDCADEWFKITATCPLCVRPIDGGSRPAPQDSNV